MGIGFAEALLFLGLLLAAVAALSGLLHRTVLSMAVLSVLTGVGLALAGVIDPSPSSEVVVLSVELALVLTLDPPRPSSRRSGSRRPYATR